MSLAYLHPVSAPRRNAVRGRRRGAAQAWPALAFALTYAAGPAIGFVLLAALFRLGVLAEVGVLFYRGLALIAVAFAATFALLFVAARRFGHGGVRGRDAFSAAVLSLALNLSFLVILPVTVDRSISVFILGEMAAHQDRGYSSDQMSRVFSDVYVGDYRQIDRRMREQVLSGNMERIGDGYRITPRGQAFIRTAKLIAWMFDSDTRFVSPPADPAASSAPQRPTMLAKR